MQRSSIKWATDKLPEFFLYGIVFTLPFGNIQVNNVFIIAFFIAVFVSKPINKLKNIRKAIGWILLFSLPFFIHILSLFLHEDHHATLKLIERNSPILLFTIVFLAFNKHKEETFYKMQLVLIFACFLAAFYCWGAAVFTVIQSNEPAQYFTLKYCYHMLSGFIGMQGNYIALYVLMAIVFIVFLHEKKYYFRSRWWTWCSVVVLSLFLFHLSIRGVLLNYILVAFSYMVYKIYRDKSLLPLAVFVVGVLLSFLVISSFFPHLYYRISSQTIEIKEQIPSEEKSGFTSNNKKTKNEKSTIEVKEKRIKRWEAAWDIYTDHVWWGTGAGKDQYLLDAVYEERNLSIALYYSYNAHNQFLQFLLTNGIPGLLSFLVCLGVLFFMGVRKRNWLAVIFICSFALFSFTESSLRRNKGVVFYSLFNAIFLLQLLEKRTEKKISKNDFILL